MSNNSPWLSYAALLVYTTAITIVVFVINGRSLIGIDDANIYMVYMRNLANGHGFVYNAGGEHVEGFTSILWVLIGAVFFCGSNKPEFLLLLLNVLISSYLLWSVCSFINSRWKHKNFFSLPVCLFLGLMVAIPGYFEWSVLSLMETGFWSLLLTLLALNILTYNEQAATKGTNFRFAILLVLLVFCRPESILWSLLFLLFRFFQMVSQYKKFNTAFRKSLPLLLLVIVCIAGVVMGRLFYFGYPLPNTYYAKVSGDKIANLKAGGIYLYRYFRDTPIFIFIFLLIGVCLIRQLKKSTIEKNSYPSGLTETIKLYFIIAVALLSVAFPIYSGGDHFGYSRLMQPTLPLTILLLIMLFDVFNFQLSKGTVCVIVCFTLFSATNNILYTFIKRASPIKEGWDLAVEKRTESEKLNYFFAKLKHYPSQGVSAAGGSAFAYKGITIDLLGLNNSAMAHADKIKDPNAPKNHASFNKTVFYQQLPDLFWLEGGFVSNRDSLNLPVSEYRSRIFKNIDRDLDFKNLYSGCLIVDRDSSWALKIFALNSFLKTIDTSNYRIIRIK